MGFTVLCTGIVGIGVGFSSSQAVVCSVLAVLGLWEILVVPE